MKLEIYQRSDGRYAWRLVARNGRIIATDGGQGYARRGTCRNMAKRATGYYSVMPFMHNARVKRPDVNIVDVYHG